MILSLILMVLFSVNLFAQLDKCAIKEVLELQQIKDVDLVTEQIYNLYVEKNSYQTSDLLKGIGYSILSGTSLGIFESNAFGYKYPHLSGGWLKDYLTWNTPTDKVFGKIFYPQKISREALSLTTRAALNLLKKYFKGNLFFAYPCWWVLHNTIATVYRDWAKHGDASYSFDFNLIL